MVNTCSKSVCTLYIHGFVDWLSESRLCQFIPKKYRNSVDLLQNREKNINNRESCNSWRHVDRPLELWLPKYRKNLANCNSWLSQMWIWLFLILSVKSSAPGHIWGECKHAWMNLRQFKSLETSQPEQPRRKSVTLPGSVPDHYVLHTTSSWLTVPVTVCGVDSSYRCPLP